MVPPLVRSKASKAPSERSLSLTLGIWPEAGPRLYRVSVSILDPVGGGRYDRQVFGAGFAMIFEGRYGLC